MACNKITKLSLISIVFFMTWDGTTAQSGCTTTLMGLAPCLNYVNGNSSSPSSSCCSQLSSVVQSSPQCLCLLLNGTASSYGYNINQTAALALPPACNVQTPPASRCDAGSGTSSGSPKGSTQPNLPSGTGSKNVPSTDATPSGGINIKAPSIVVGFFLVVAASCVLSVNGF